MSWQKVGNIMGPSGPPGGGAIISQVINATHQFNTPLTAVSGTPYNLLSITLPAGDWDVRGSAGFLFGAGSIPNTVFRGSAAISATPLAITDDGFQGYCSWLARSAIVSWLETVALPSRKISVTAPTQVIYLVVQGDFHNGSCGVFGFIEARNWTSAGAEGGITSQVVDEIPAGAIDGMNTIFTTAQAFTGSDLFVYLNGLRQHRLTDFAIINQTSFQMTNPPLVGDTLTVDYLI